LLTPFPIVAEGLLRGGGARNVLVVAADAIAPGNSRIVPPEISVASDAAASVVMSVDDDGLFELLGTARHRASIAYEKFPQEDFTIYLKTVARALEKIRQDSLAPWGGSAEGFRWLIPNNFNTSVTRLISMQMAFAPSQVYTENIRRFGHGLGADVLLNLCDCFNNEQVDSGDRVLLLASGPNQWATVALEKT